MVTNYLVVNNPKKLANKTLLNNKHFIRSFKSKKAQGSNLEHKV